MSVFRKLTPNPGTNAKERKKSPFSQSSEKKKSSFSTPVTLRRLMSSSFFKNANTTSSSSIFSNEKILESILFSFSTNELLELRLVNKSWNQAACKILREKIEGVLILQRGLSYYTQVMETSLDIPVGRVFLNLHSTNDPSVQNFFRATGYAILHLIVSLPCDQVFSLLPHLLHCTNLEELVINISVPKSKRSNNSNFNSLETSSPGKSEFMTCCLQIINELEHQNKKHILSPQNSLESISFLQRITSIEEDVFISEEFENSNNHMISIPNLQSISIYCDCPTWSIKSTNQQWVAILLSSSDCLKQITISKWSLIYQPSVTFSRLNIHQLSSLVLQTPVPSSLLQTFSNKGRTALKHVSLELAQDVEQNVLTDFLCTIAPTVISLQIQNSLSQPNFILPYVFPKLQILKICGWKSSVYIHFTPQNGLLLRSLEIKDVVANKLFVSDDCPTPLVHVVSLSLDLLQYSDIKEMEKVEQVKKFIRLFPNLKALKTSGMNDQLISCVIKGWSQLEVLIMKVDDGFTDRGLTGMDFTKGTETRPSFGNPPSCTDPEAVHYFQQERMEPHIGSLCNLKELTIEASPGTKLAITNASVQHGIKYLKNLNYMKIKCQGLGPFWCLTCIADNMVNLKELFIMDRSISDSRYSERDVRRLLQKLGKLRLHFLPQSRLYIRTPRNSGLNKINDSPW